MIGSRRPVLLILVMALVLGVGPLVARAGAQELADDGNASWKLEQPAPPTAPPGVEESKVPIGLGHVGDIEFWGPKRGLLITAGNPPSIPAGIWAYNGISWHELSNVCGATDGRIAWVGPEEFWTVSDGRPGQANVEGKPPLLTDDTLCHFSTVPVEHEGHVVEHEGHVEYEGRVVGSYAAPSFTPTSYQPMHAAACLEPSDCWFAGEPLPSEYNPEPGAFQLHWNGSTLTEEPNPQGHAVEDLRRFGDELFESVLIRPTYNPPQPDNEDRLTEPESPFSPSDLHTIAANGAFKSLVSTEEEVPVYPEGEAPWELEALHLSTDEEAPKKEVLWGVADPLPYHDFTPEAQAAALPAGEVTIVRDAGGVWRQVIGPIKGGTNPFTKFQISSKGQEAKEKENEVVRAIAGEPGGDSAWLGLSHPADTAEEQALVPATVARIASDGAVSDRETLPSAEEAAEGVGAKGIPSKIVCPAAHDCWMVTTHGWLFHLADKEEREHPSEEPDPAFAHLITERPADEGLPQEPPDAPPTEESNQLGEAPPTKLVVEAPKPVPFATVVLPLLSKVSTRLVDGTTLELSFHLAVKARIRLLAERRKRVVASTPMRTLTAGNRKLLLRLNVHDWPTKLALQTHALAPLPTTTTLSAGTETVSTSLAFPNANGRPSGPLGTLF
jgi:hypothetical protein